MFMQYMLENELISHWLEKFLGKMGDKLIIQITDDQRQEKPVS